jgi:Tfp pilus assembly protein PilF
MSLLLEALKKAEQAKQGESTMQPGAGAGAPPTAGEGLSLADEAAAAAHPGTSQPITRDRLPDITQNLEILSDELPSGAGAAGSGPGRARPAERSPSGLGRGLAGHTPGGKDEARVADREAARQLFEAHTPDYDPRRPFKLVLAGLAVGAIGVVVYFWWQMQPHSLMVAQRPPPPSQHIAAAPKPPAPAPQAAPTPSEPEPSPSQPVASMPAGAAEPPPPQSAMPASTSSGTVPTPPQPMPSFRPTPRPAKPASRPQSTAAEEPLPGASGTMSIHRTQSSVNADVASGYSALEAGDVATARTQYDRALRSDPLNRDALLGLAALDVRAGDYGQAIAHYAKVLEIDPRDPNAAAGLIGLRGTLDPVEAESRLKNLLADQSDSAVLHFALGNVFATQSRWAEAQQSYFRAVAADPDSPNYEFNLAVSLDHLHKEKLALEHYQRALALAGSRSAAFNKSQAEARIRDLQR